MKRYESETTTPAINPEGIILSAFSFRGLEATI